MCPPRSIICFNGVNSFASYTPYQPEILQGTLQYLFEFQTQIAMITGMEVASASHYDGATACAEAVLMARRLTKRPGVILSGGVHPHYAVTVSTNVQYLESGLVTLPPADPRHEEDLAAQINDRTACVVVQNPDVFGRLNYVAPIAEAAHEAVRFW